MEIKVSYLCNMPIIKVSGVSDFDVRKTFDCGQSFRFDPVSRTQHESEYAGVAFGRHVSFASEVKDLYIYNYDLSDFENIWRRYLALDLDYRSINEDILASCPHPTVKEAVECGRGIRILRQDPYEAVISFIISQNNNIPRIKKIIESISAKAGKVIELSDEAKKHTSGVSSLCEFPSCDALMALGEAGLFELKTGFRAKYIFDAVSRMCDGRLDVEGLSLLNSTDDCISRLCEVKGIGLKVASCAALFGLGRYDAFPVDVWIKRVGDKYFPEEKHFSGKLFGQYAGIAQQYLFYYERYGQGSK